MVGRKTISTNQWEVILNIMKTNPAIAKGGNSERGRLESKYHEKWAELTTVLNSMVGCKKTTTQWRNFWNQSAHLALKKAIALRKQLVEAGNSKVPARVLGLTDLEKRIVKVALHVKKELPEAACSPLDNDKTLTPRPSSSVSPEPHLPPPQSHILDAPAPTLLSDTPSTSVGAPEPTPTKNSSSRSSDDLAQPQKVAVVEPNMSRISLEDLNYIQNELQQRLWSFMVDTSTANHPTFEYCSILEPFGLILKCCNLDAVDWLTNTLEGTVVVGRKLEVITDNLESKLPKTVNLCVNIADFGNKDIESIFKVLVRTNKSWLNTPQWTLLDDKCVSVTSLDPSDCTSLCIVFSVLLNDIRRLREGGFKLHFLFGVIPVYYYEEAKAEV